MDLGSGGQVQLDIKQRLHIITTARPSIFPVFRVLADEPVPSIVYEFIVISRFIAEQKLKLQDERARGYPAP
jgi:hypothetical protein